MSELDLKKEHVWFNEENSKLLRDYANKRDISVTKAANELIGMIAKMEVKTELTLKQNEQGKKETDIKFKKNISFSVKI